MSDISRDITEIARCCAQYKVDMLSPMGLKGCHASYLSEICACPGISQDKLAQRIYINKSNVARQAAYLEEEGFITRTPSANDKRVLELYPTEKATALLPEVHAILQEWNQMLTHDLTEEEMDTVMRVLLKMQEKAGAWMNDH